MSRSTGYKQIFPAPTAVAESTESLGDDPDEWRCRKWERANLSSDQYHHRHWLQPLIKALKDLPRTRCDAITGDRDRQLRLGGVVAELTHYPNGVVGNEDVELILQDETGYATIRSSFSEFRRFELPILHPGDFVHVLGESQPSGLPPHQGRSTKAQPYVRGDYINVGSRSAVKPDLPGLEDTKWIDVTASPIVRDLYAKITRANLDRVRKHLRAGIGDKLHNGRFEYLANIEAAIEERLDIAAERAEWAADDEISKEVATLRARADDVFSDSRVEGYLRSVSGEKFEEFLANLFASRGWAVERTQLTGDRGIDIRLEDRGRVNQQWIVQAKGYSTGNTVGRDIVDQLVGTIEIIDEPIHTGLLAATSDFTEPAKKAAQGTRVELLDLEDLRALVLNTWSREAD